MLDGGAKPLAPPGKGTESPPPPDEFKKTLNEASKEDKTPGEVAGKEPNAPPQKPDSKEKEKENCDAKPNVAIANLPIALLAQQATTMPVALATPVHIPTNEITGDPKKFLATQAAPIAEVASTNVEVQGLAKSMSKALPADLKTLKLNAPNSKVIGFTDATTKQDANRLVLPANGQNKIDLPKELNVQSVQTSQSAEITAQPEVATQVVKAAAGEVKTDAKATLDVKLDAKGVAATSQTAHAVVSAKQGESLSQGFDRQESKSDDSKDSDDLTAEIGSTAKTDAPTNQLDATPVKGDVKLDSVNRQRLVDTVSQKIDELSVRSVRNEVRVQMQPAEMGTVVVNVRKDLEGLTATLTATNEPLRQALHESRNDLAGALADRTVGQVRVEVRSASSDTMNMGQQFSNTQSNAQQNHQQQQLHKQAAANMAAARRESESQPAETSQRPARAASSALLDLEI